MRKWQFHFLLCTVALSSSAVSKTEFTAQEARGVLYNYAKCAVKRRHAMAVEVIVANIDNHTLVEKYQPLFSPDCLANASEKLGVEMGGGLTAKFAGDLFRYALADALVSADLKNLILHDLQVVAPLQHREFNEDDYRIPPSENVEKTEADAKEKMRLQAIADIYLSRFGECVVRADAGNAHTLLMTRPSSAEEGQAFTKLIPAISGCVEVGQKLTLNRSMVRGPLALNYYRLAMAPRNPVQEPH